MAQQRLPMADVDSSPVTDLKRPERRLPSWFKVTLPTGASQQIFKTTRKAVEDNSLHTVCEEARCPNIHDCWGRGTATFMIAGDTCTRGCRFCAVNTAKNPPALDATEPARLAEAIRLMQLSYAVITVVNRDDLPDGGAGHFRSCLDAIHALSPQVGLELLCSDLEGDLLALELLLDEAPLRVFAHNVECVPSMDAKVRDRRASFAQSLKILGAAAALRPDIQTKSSLMVGVGETDAEISAAMQSLREVGVSMLTIGQYLQPSPNHLAIDRFPEPEKFAEWDAEARQLGFSAVACGPLVRSSYRAGDLLNESRTSRAESQPLKDAWVESTAEASAKQTL
jgi:lipoic acid synthetase